VTGFRRRLGTARGAVSKWLLEGMAEVDFPARLGVSLTQALTELARSRQEAAARAADPALADFRGRPGLEPVAAAGELVGPGKAPAATGGAARGPARPILGLAVHLRRPLAVGIAVVAVTGGATASSLWLAPAGNPVFGYNPGLVSTPPPAAQLGALAVLRRPQTDGERGAGVHAALADVNNFTTGMRSNYVRVLATSRAGAVVLVPVKRRDASAAGAAAQLAIDDALCVYYPFSDPGSLNNNTHCWSTEQLLAGQALAGIGNHEYGLVPDRVSSVLVTLGPWKKSVTVAGNFFDVTLPTGGGTTTSPPTGVPISPTITFSRSAS
jgi:hypothetical protein